MWVYTKGSARTFNVKVNRVGLENCYYSVELPDGTIDHATVEVSLNKEIEIPGNVVLDLIRSEKPITPEQKLTLSRYISVMLERGPHGRTRKQRIAHRQIVKLRSELEQELHPKDFSIAQKILEDYQENLPKSFLLNFGSEGVTKALTTMTWQFFVTADEQGFVTSDNPVVFSEEKGIEDKSSEIIFPISRRIALWATWRSDLPEIYVEVDQEGVRDINRQTVSFADKFVYYSHASPHVEALLNDQPAS